MKNLKSNRYKEIKLSNLYILDIEKYKKEQNSKMMKKYNANIRYQESKGKRLQ